jgi:hypothetical protein
MQMTNGQRTGLFDILGRLWYCAAQERTQYQQNVTTLNNLIGAIEAGIVIPRGTLQAELRYQLETLRQPVTGLTPTILRFTRDIVRRAVAAELGGEMSEAEAAAEVIRQMRSAGYYVTPSTISVQTASNGGNVGDAALVAPPIMPDGYPGPLWVPESGSVAWSGLAALAQSADAVPLSSVAWPGGSGYRWEAIPTVPLDAGTLQNPGLTVADGIVSGWIARGNRWEALLPPRDEIVFSASPTGGTFRLAFTNRFGLRRVTRDIPYNATSTTVAGELAALDTETATASVSPRSAGPGFTVDWPYGRYDLPALEIESALQGATATVQRVRAGTAGGYAGTGIRFTGDASELTGLYQRFTAQGRGLALFVCRIFHDGATSGTLQLALVNGATSTAVPINRPNGDANALSVALSSLAANTFHTLICPIAWDGNIDGYLAIRLTTALTANKKVAINRPQLVQVTAQTITRPGIFLLTNRFGAAATDRWTWTISNNFAGSVLTWWMRAFNDATLALPRTGSTLIPNSIIAQ